MPSIKKRQTTFFCVIFGALLLLWSEDSTQPQLRVQTYSTQTQRQVQSTDESNSTLAVPSTTTPLSNYDSSDDDIPTIIPFLNLIHWATAVV